MAAVPLNGRSFTDLLSLQPGVAPSTTIELDTVQDVGATILEPSGTLNPGTISVNGQRETANYLQRERQRCGRGRERRHGNYSQPRCNCGVSHRDEQLRCRVWGVQRRTNQRGHKIRQQRIPRQLIRFSAQYRSGCAQLLFAHPRGLSPEPVWRNAGRPDSPRQGILLHGLSRHAADAGHRHRRDQRAVECGPHGQLIRHGGQQWQQPADGSRWGPVSSPIC